MQRTPACGGFLTTCNLLFTFFILFCCLLSTTTHFTLIAASSTYNAKLYQHTDHVIDLLPQHNSQHLTEGYNFTILDEYFNHQFIHQRLQGSFALQIGDQTWIKQFDQSQKLIDNNTMYRFGGVTKTYIAVLAAIAIDKKLMRWDTTIDTFLNTTRYSKTFTYANSITVYHLLTMKSGLSCDYTWIDPEVGRAYNMTFDSFVNAITSRSFCQRDPYLIVQPSWSEADYWLLSRWLPFVFGIIRSEDDLDGGFTELIEKEITKPLNLLQTTTLLSIHHILNGNNNNTNFGDHDDDALNNLLENDDNNNNNNELNVSPFTYHLNSTYHWIPYKRQIDISKAGGAFGIIASPQDVMIFYQKIFVNNELISNSSRQALTQWNTQSSGSIYGMGLRLLMPMINNTSPIYKKAFGEVSSFDYSLSGVLHVPAVVNNIDDIDNNNLTIQQQQQPSITFTYSLNGIALPADFMIDAIVNFTQFKPLYLLDYKKGDIDSEKDEVYKNIIGHYSFTSGHLYYTIKRIKYDNNKGTKYKCALPYKKSGLIISNDDDSIYLPETPLVWKGPNPDGHGYGGTNIVDDEGRIYWHFVDYPISSLYFENKKTKNKNKDNQRKMWLFTAGTVALDFKYYTLQPQTRLHIGRWIITILLIIILVVGITICCIRRKKKEQRQAQQNAMNINEFTINTDSEQYVRL